MNELKRKTIAIFRNERAIGGAEIYTVELIKKISLYFKKVILVTNLKKEFEKYLGSIKNLKIIFLWPIKNIFVKQGFFYFIFYFFPKAFLKWIFFHLKYQPNLYHVQRVDDLFILGIIKLVLKNKLKLIYTHHGEGANIYLFKGRNFLRKIMVKRVFLVCDKIIFVSSPSLSKVQKILGFPLQNAAIIQNGIDLNRFNPKLFPKKQTSKLIVGTACRLSKEKRLDLFLKAAKEISKAISNVEFWIIGDGPEKENLKKLTKELNLESKVKFLGFQEKPEEFVSQMDVFLVTSETEGFPLAPLEAKALGIPIVAFAVGGLCEQIEDGKDGFLVPFGDISQLSQKAILLLKDKKLREQMSLTALERAKEFSLERMIDKTLAVYKEVLDETK